MSAPVGGMNRPVDGLTNSQKSDSDAAAWLPPNKGYRCICISRQIDVKAPAVGDPGGEGCDEPGPALMLKIVSSCRDARTTVTRRW